MTDDSSLNEDSISPEKRISESNPRELELAFRQVLIQTPKAGDSSQSDPLVDAIPTEEETSEGKSKGHLQKWFYTLGRYFLWRPSSATPDNDDFERLQSLSRVILPTSALQQCLWC
jgi:hypothetical protein